MTGSTELPLLQPVEQGELLVPGLDVALVTATVDNDGPGRDFVTINSLCDAFGLAARAQRAKVADPNSIYRLFAANIEIETAGGRQAALCLDAIAVPFFMAQIQTSRVGDAVNAEALRRFQLECVGILAEHFGTGERGEVDQIRRVLGLAAAQQLDFDRTLDERLVEARQAMLAEVDEKLASARKAFAAVRSEVRRLGGIVSPKERITPEEVGTIQDMVKQLGVLLEERGEQRPYPGIYSDIFNMAGVSKTDFIPREKLGDVISFLDDRIHAVRRSLKD